MKDAYYFTHDSNAKDDPKCVLLIEQLGLEGYGIFWILVETLREQPNYMYPLKLLPALARRFNTTNEKIKAVVLNYEFFTITDNEFFFSESLNSRMLKLENKREQNRLAGQISAANRRKKLLELSIKAENELTSVEHMLNKCKTHDEPVKESKEEESKEKESNNINQIEKSKLFYDNQIVINSDKPDIDKYKKFVACLFGENKVNEVYTGVLSIPIQLSYDVFCNVLDESRKRNKKITSILMKMSNKEKYYEKFNSLPILIYKWLETDYK